MNTPTLRYDAVVIGAGASGLERRAMQQRARVEVALQQAVAAARTDGLLAHRVQAERHLQERPHRRHLQLLLS